MTAAVHLEAAHAAVDDDAERDEHTGGVDVNARQRVDDGGGANDEGARDKQVVGEEQVQEHLCRA